MNVNFNNNLAFNGKIDCKGVMLGMRKTRNPEPFTINESMKLIGSSDFSHEYDSEKTIRRIFEFDTKRVIGINEDAIYFASDDGKIYAQLFYQPKGATDIERKLNYMVAMNAYNTAHQNNIETKIVC